MSETPKQGIVAPSRAGPLDVPVTPRNPGMPLELEWVEDVRVNRSAVERRAATLHTRRTVKKEWQAAWLLRAITLMDLTTLGGDDTQQVGIKVIRKYFNDFEADDAGLTNTGSASAWMPGPARTTGRWRSSCGRRPG